MDKFHHSLASCNRIHDNDFMKKPIGAANKSVKHYIPASKSTEPRGVKLNSEFFLSNGSFQINNYSLLKVYKHCVLLEVWFGLVS